LRGSRDGFGAGDFHCRCDGHAPTLALIEDTAGNIFGGFTPVGWESSRAIFGGNKADPSVNGFLFRLKNPHNFPARKFALKAKEKYRAIWCDSGHGPHFFGSAYANDSGSAYANDTGLDGTTVLTGSLGFTVKEIEVFPNPTRLPRKSRFARHPKKGREPSFLPATGAEHCTPARLYGHFAELRRVPPYGSAQMVFSLEAERRLPASGSDPIPKITGHRWPLTELPSSGSLTVWRLQLAVSQKYISFLLS
jgi:hypothetical protein